MQDVAALYAYFMHGVERAYRAPSTQMAFPWPLSIRWPVAIWRKLFAPSPDAPAFNASRYADPVVARGAYLVEGPGHCGTCHTPRAVTLQEKALDDSSTVFLAGGQQIGGWVAVNLRGNVGDGLGDWSKEDIVATLRTGAQRAAVGHRRTDERRRSAQHAKFERAGPAGDCCLPQDIGAVARAMRPSSRRIRRRPPRLRRGKRPIAARKLYDDNCAACHHTDGEGSPKALPKIAGNSSVLAQDPNSLIRLVLAGSALPGTTAAPSPLGMPGFAWRLSNDEVAQLLTFIRTGWGNQASSVTASEVARVRGALNAETPPQISAN